MNAPYLWDELNKWVGSYQPSTLHIKNTYSYNYFRRALYDRIISVGTWTIPEEWNRDYFLFFLYNIGFLAVIPTAEFGTIPQICSLNKVGVFLQPTDIIVRNDFLNFAGRINEDCALIKLTPDYMGINDIIQFYAGKLAELDGTLDQAFTNERFAYIVAAKGKSAAETLKKAFDIRNAGSPLAVVDKYSRGKAGDELEDQESPWDFLDLNIGENYISDRLLADYRTIMNMFDAEIGISNIQMEKKERLITAEVEQNQQETDSRLTTWTECLQRSISETIKLFPDLSGRLSFEPPKREGDVSNEADIDRIS